MDSTPASAFDHAMAASEAIRQLNHTTTPWGEGYEYAPDIDATLGAIHELLHRLDQTFTQAGRWLETAYGADVVGHDDPGANLDTVIPEIVKRLRDAGIDSSNLAVGVQDVRSLTSHLTGIDPS